MDLFSDAPSILPHLQSRHLSRSQKTFNNLIDKLEKKRLVLAAWESAIPRFQHEYATKMQPLVEQAEQARLEFVRALDRAYQQKGLGKTDRRLLAELICDYANGFAVESDDPEMKALYNQYSGGDFDQEEAESREAMKSMLKNGFGVDLGDDFDLSSPEALIKQMQDHLAQEAEKQHADERARRENHQTKRKRTAKQIAREEKLLEESLRVNLSLREIYRKLASALHPDRELDPEERLRKTGLMQRVNQAYDKKDLMGLLQLQLEIEHIDQATINSLSEERLTHYNQILKEQLAELEEQIAHVDYDFRLRFGFDRYVRLEPASLMRVFETNLTHARQQLRNIQTDLNATQAIATLKTWLKSMRRKLREQPLDDWDSEF